MVHWMVRLNLNWKKIIVHSLQFINLSENFQSFLGNNAVFQQYSAKYHGAKIDTLQIYDIKVSVKDVSVKNNTHFPN